MTGGLRDIRLWSCRATPHTVWLFVEAEDAAGRTGWGEATLAGQEDAVAAAAARHRPALLAHPTSDAQGLEPLLGFCTLPEAAFSSAAMQAVADIDAQRAGVPLWAHLGGRAAAGVPVYANINRRTRPRDPATMAASARAAILAGHDAIKIAPFDEVSPTLGRAEMRAAMQPGLARLAAIREALGPDVDLMADCHWRFDTDGAREAIAAVASLGLHWMECPIAEEIDRIPDLIALRSAASDAGMLLAGLETRIRLAGFAPYLKAGCYNVVMPDVKYAGGPWEMARLAAAADRAGAVFSPHNPSGPVCHAHSLHICAALPGAGRLEMQFDETPLFDAICDVAVAAPDSGAVTLRAGTAGLGLSLRKDCLELLNDRP